MREEEHLGTGGGRRWVPVQELGEARRVGELFP